MRATLRYKDKVVCDRKAQVFPAARVARLHPTVQGAGSSRAGLLSMFSLIRNSILFIMHGMFGFELVRQPSPECSEY
jgi:hypothetical protein